MPRNLSAWMDLTVHLVVMLALISVLYFYNEYVACGAAVLWLCLASFARERCADRSRRFDIYFSNGNLQGIHQGKCVLIGAVRRTETRHSYADNALTRKSQQIKCTHRNKQCQRTV